ITHTIGDDQGPVIEVQVPETFETFNESLVVVKGLVSDETDVAKITVEGKEVELQKADSTNKYVFEKEAELEDGVQPIHITATDVNGNETKLANSRSIIVDTTPPELGVKAPTYVGFGTKQADITSFVSDNFEELTLNVNDSEVYSHEMQREEM